MRRYDVGCGGADVSEGDGGDHGTAVGNVWRLVLAHDGGCGSRREFLVCERVILVLKDI